MKSSIPLLLLLLLLITACEKEELVPTEAQRTDVAVSGLNTRDASIFQTGTMAEPDSMDNMANRTRCWSFVYPISYALPDGETITGNDEMEVGLALRAWYADNPNVEERPTLVFPLSVMLASGESQILDDASQLRRVQASCNPSKPGSGRPSSQACFSYVYPLTYDLPDGTQLTGEDAVSTAQALRAWMADNPDAEGNPTLAFPLTVVLPDGEEFELSGQDQFDRLRASCNNDRPTNEGAGPREPCYSFTFPITYRMPDGTDITGEDEDSLARAIRQWYADNPEVRVSTELVFPVKIQVGEEIIEVSDMEALQAIRESC